MTNLKAAAIVVIGCLLGAAIAFLVVAVLTPHGDLPGGGFGIVVITGFGGIAGAVLGAMWSPQTRQR